MQSDPYVVLGIQRGSSEQQIKDAYRRLVLQWHPDRNKAPNATAMFIKIQEAYEAITKGTAGPQQRERQPSGYDWTDFFRRRQRQEEERARRRRDWENQRRAARSRRPSRPRRPRSEWRVDMFGRQCSRCGLYKPWDQFEHDKRRQHGRGPRCKQCIRDKI